MRAIGIGKLQLLRTSLLGTLFESLAMMTGGILYTFGEVVLMQIELGKWQMSTSQHVIMSLSITLLGSFYLLYQVQMLPGAIWAFSPAFLWFILGILWLLHPQDNPFFEFGHNSIGWMFIAVCVSRAMEAALALYTSPQHHTSVAAQQQRQNMPLTLRHIFHHLHSMCTNQFAFATPFPFFTAITLMIIGTWDWQLAVGFAEKLDLATNANWMEAEESWLIHILVNVTLAAFLWGILGLWQRNQRGGTPTADEYLDALIDSENSSSHGLLDEPIELREDM
ncbi:MAG: hypothetical protein Q8P67_24630 [archaeon]|nr:hypothetical protein [archaeon]